MPEDFTLEQKQNLSRVLKKNGINTRQIKTKFFMNYFKTRPVNPQILALFMVIFFFLYFAASSDPLVADPLL